ncbi:MAG TPA: TPM domain-containing protein [Kiritimatiellae bacterium]|nr:TPM domain-containing protein [Kiritimatiellia bacterium]
MKAGFRPEIILGCLALMLLVAGCSHPGPDPEQMLRSLRPQGFVSDYARILPPGVRRDLENRLMELQESQAAEISVVVLPSIGGADINDFASRLFERWGIGRKSRDNGILFLVALRERRVRIEVGYGLEARVTDAVTGRILDRHVMPRFRGDDLVGGIVNGTLALVDLVGKAAARPEAAGNVRGEAPSATRVGWTILIMLLAIGLLIRHPFLGYVLLTGMGGSGGFGGGFGGFGGGASGGGGASRGW